MVRLDGHGGGAPGTGTSSSPGAAAGASFSVTSSSTATAWVSTDPMSRLTESKSNLGTEDLASWIGRILRGCFRQIGIRGARRPWKQRPAGSYRELPLRVRTNGPAWPFSARLEEALVGARHMFDVTVTDQSIDLCNVVGLNLPSNMTISYSCIIKHTNRTAAVTLSGISGPDPVGRIRFSSNLVLGGPVFATDVRELYCAGQTPSLSRRWRRRPIAFPRKSSGVGRRC